MANIKLGSIVTSIRGSIGGTTFRRTPAGHIVYNKQQQQFKSAAAIGSQRIAIGSIMQSWSLLSTELQKTWNDQAALFPFKDKFAQDKFLTGRQLYIKLNAQLLPVNQTVSNPTLIESTLEFPEILGLSINVLNEEAILNLKQAITVSNLCVSFYRVRTKSQVKPHAHFRVNQHFSLTTTALTDIWDGFKEAFPLGAAGMYVGCNIYSINQWGFKSPVTSIVVLVA